ncbi:hypothetical protein ACQR1W_32990 [Bradyrhizobium sp. HKCCYLS1011]|uniref:hypothetical protein n=1 Tax=Bradyrhizobium sp. HKCCYLS1011 TaxID=3420733 RepID=UPI003EBAE9A1
MTVAEYRRAACRLASFAGLLGLAPMLAACAGMSDNMSTAFADPAKYELYDCKQLETERKNLANRSAELQGLMAKAETGTGGAVVAELAYRNDYVSVRGQSQLAEEAWRRNKCQETPPPPPTPAAHAKGVKAGTKAGSKAAKPAKLPNPAGAAAQDGPPTTLPKDGSTY